MDNEHMMHMSVPFLYFQGSAVNMGRMSVGSRGLLVCA